ncbi:unnamed protein product [Chrysoparadoxa australica]
MGEIWGRKAASGDGEATMSQEKTNQGEGVVEVVSQKKKKREKVRRRRKPSYFSMLMKREKHDDREANQVLLEQLHLVGCHVSPQDITQAFHQAHCENPGRGSITVPPRTIGEGRAFDRMKARKLLAEKAIKLAEEKESRQGGSQKIAQPKPSTIRPAAPTFTPVNSKMPSCLTEMPSCRVLECELSALQRNYSLQLLKSKETDTDSQELNLIPVKVKSPPQHQPHSTLTHTQTHSEFCAQLRRRALGMMRAQEELDAGRHHNLHDEGGQPQQVGEKQEEGRVVPFRPDVKHVHTHNERYAQLRRRALAMMKAQEEGGAAFGTTVGNH